MYTCISIHNNSCSSDCVNCYLKKRTTDLKEHPEVRFAKLTPPVLVRMIDMAHVDFGVKELALGINDSANASRDRYVSQEQDARWIIENTLESITKRLTISIDSPLITEARILGEMGRRLDEIYLSIDGSRLCVEGAGTDAIIRAITLRTRMLRERAREAEIWLSVTADRYSINRLKDIGKAVATEYTSARNGGREPTITGMHVITVRNVHHDDHQIERITDEIQSFFDSLVGTIPTEIEDRFDIDHCTLMAVNGESCGQHGLIDIDTQGGVRACVYSRKADFYLDPADPVDSFRDFLAAVKDLKAPELYGIKEIECTHCPIFYKDEVSKGNEVTGEYGDKEETSKEGGKKEGNEEARGQERGFIVIGEPIYIDLSAVQDARSSTTTGPTSGSTSTQHSQEGPITQD